MHDASGYVDPVKASQTPVPRAYSASKRARTDADAESPVLKRQKVLEDDDSQSYTGPRPDSLLEKTESNSTGIPANDTIAGQPQTIADHLLDPSLMDHTESGCKAGPSSMENHSMTFNDPFGPLDPALAAGSLQQGFMKPATRSDGPQHEVEARQAHVPITSTIGPVNGMLPEDEMLLGEDVKPEESGQDHEEQPISDKGLTLVRDDGLPDNQDPENRSRTPSLRVQTNSSESNGADGSRPSSPLTELELSSPIGVEEAIEPIQSSAHNGATAHRKSSKKVSSTGVTPKQIRRTPSRASSSATPLKTSTSRSSTGPTTSKRRSLSKGHHTGPVASPTAFLGSPMALSPEEDASMKLIREMQEQEFGLRRRRD